MDNPRLKSILGCHIKDVPQIDPDNENTATLRNHILELYLHISALRDQQENALKTLTNDFNSYEGQVQELQARIQNNLAMHNADKEALRAAMQSTSVLKDANSDLRTSLRIIDKVVSKL